MSDRDADEAPKGYARGLTNYGDAGFSRYLRRGFARSTGISTKMLEKPIVGEWAASPLDREIVIARVVDADRETAFEAWTDPAQIVQWFGPDGFQIKSHEADIRTGGIWRFDMVAPDGTRFSNRMDFLRVETPDLIEVDHGQDIDDDPDCFRLLVTFDEQDNGKTVVTLRQMHPTPERRAAVIGFGAVEYGAQTLDKLAAHVADKMSVVAARG